MSPSRSIVRVASSADSAEPDTAMTRSALRSRDRDLVLADLEQPRQQDRHRDQRVGLVLLERVQGELRVGLARDDQRVAQPEARASSCSSPHAWNAGAASTDRAPGAQRDLRQVAAGQRQRQRHVARARPSACRWCRWSAARSSAWLPGCGGREVPPCSMSPSTVVSSDFGSSPSNQATNLPLDGSTASATFCELLVVDERGDALALADVGQLRAGEVGVEQQGAARRAWRRRGSSRTARGGCGHRMPSPSLAETPRSRRALASAVLLLVELGKVSAPSSSMIAGRSRIARGGQRDRGADRPVRLEVAQRPQKRCGGVSATPAPRAWSRVAAKRASRVARPASWVAVLKMSTVPVLPARAAFGQSECVTRGIGYSGVASGEVTSVVSSLGSVWSGSTKTPMSRS